MSAGRVSQDVAQFVTNPKTLTENLIRKLRRLFLQVLSSSNRRSRRIQKRNSFQLAHFAAAFHQQIKTRKPSYKNRTKREEREKKGKSLTRPTAENCVRISEGGEKTTRKTARRARKTMSSDDDVTSVFLIV